MNLIVATRGGRSQDSVSEDNFSAPPVRVERLGVVQGAVATVHFAAACSVPGNMRQLAANLRGCCNTTINPIEPIGLLEIMLFVRPTRGYGGC